MGRVVFRRPETDGRRGTGAMDAELSKFDMVCVKVEEEGEDENGEDNVDVDESLFVEEDIPE